MSAPHGAAFERDLHRHRKERAARWTDLTPEQAANEANREAGRALQWLAGRRTHPARPRKRAA